MTHGDGRTDTKREARSIARLMVIMIAIAAIPAVAIILAWAWWA